MAVHGFRAPYDIIQLAFLTVDNPLEAGAAKAGPSSRSKRGSIEVSTALPQLQHAESGLFAARHDGGLERELAAGAMSAGSMMASQLEFEVGTCAQLQRALSIAAAIGVHAGVSKYFFADHFHYANFNSSCMIY